MGNKLIFYLMIKKNFLMNQLLGSEVDKLFKLSIKTSNVTKNIESDIQNTKPPRTDDPII